MATATISGDVVPTTVEDDWTTASPGGHTIIITLDGATWFLEESFDATRQTIIDGITSAQSEATGWNNIIRDTMDVSQVTRIDEFIVQVLLGYYPTYDITATETITVTIDDTVISGGTLIATPTFDITPSANPSAEVTGTITPTSPEAEVVTGSQTIIITLTDDTWVAVGATFNAQRQAIINGLDAASSPATGWNLQVRDTLAVTTVVRTSDDVVTITLSAIPAYNISSAETITVTVPGTAVEGGVDLDATPTFDITVDLVPVVMVSGTVVPTAVETEIVSGGQTIILTLADETWVAAGATFNAQRQAILDGLDSATGGGTAWNAQVRDLMGVATVVRTSATVVTIMLTAAAAYAITIAETITVTVPGAAVVGGNPLIATPTFTITPTSMGCEVETIGLSQDDPLTVGITALSICDTLSPNDRGLSG